MLIILLGMSDVVEEVTELKASDNEYSPESW